VLFCICICTCTCSSVRFPLARFIAFYSSLSHRGVGLKDWGSVPEFFAPLFCGDNVQPRQRNLPRHRSLGVRKGNLFVTPFGFHDEQSANQLGIYRLWVLRNPYFVSTVSVSCQYISISLISSLS